MVGLGADFLQTAHTTCGLGRLYFLERSLRAKPPGFSDHNTQHLGGRALQHFVILASIMRRGFLKKAWSSARPTNNPPPTPAPPTVEPAKQGLTTIHPQVKGLRAVAAPTSAVPLSVASPSDDPTDTALDERGSSKESRWGTAYEAAKIAIEIANASSDMFLPLKAVVGALSVLIKNYDVRILKVCRLIEC